MKYSLIQLDKTQIYSFKGCNDQHLKEVLKWLKDNDKYWDGGSIKRFKADAGTRNLHFVNVDFGYGWTNRPHTALITDLFKENTKPMRKLIIITGEQGSGKSTYARKYYPNNTSLDYYDTKQLKEIYKSLKDNDITVVCCYPDFVSSLIPEKNSGITYQIITLKNFEVVQISGRGFNPSKWQQRDIVAAEGDLHQQLEKAKAEVARLEKEIEIKVGDWCINKRNQIFKIKVGLTLNGDFRKITNPELIKLLEDESKN